METTPLVSETSAPLSNLDKWIFLISTGLLTVLMCFSAGMYLLNHDTVVGFFTELGYPTYIIYPLAIAKILGLVAIWTNKSRSLKEWAYAGFFFDFVLAWVAHIDAGHGVFQLAGIALVLLFVSYLYDRKHRGIIE